MSHLPPKRQLSIWAWYSKHSGSQLIYSRDFQIYNLICHIALSFLSPVSHLLLWGVSAAQPDKSVLKSARNDKTELWKPALSFSPFRSLSFPVLCSIQTQKGPGFQAHLCFTEAAAEQKAFRGCCDLGNEETGLGIKTWPSKCFHFEEMCQSLAHLITKPLQTSGFVDLQKAEMRGEKRRKSSHHHLPSFC